MFKTRFILLVLSALAFCCLHSTSSINHKIKSQKPLSFSSAANITDDFQFTMIEDELDDDEISGKGKTKIGFSVDLFFNTTPFSISPLSFLSSSGFSFTALQRASKYSCLRI